MLVVFYHTDDQIYTRYATLLEASLKQCGIDYYKEVIPASDWFTAINNKAAFLLRCRNKFTGDLVYIDADTFVHRDFSQDLATWDCDIAFCHYRDYISGREENLSGTVVLKDTLIVRIFLQLWKSKSVLKRLFKRPSKSARRTIARTKELEEMILNNSKIL